jgi:hypothetical protein
MKRRQWTSAEDEFLINNAHKSLKEIAKKLNRSVKAITIRRHKLKISKSVNWFTEQEDLFIKQNYCKMTAKEIGKRLGKPTQTIYNRVFKLGLVKQHKWTESEHQILLNIYQEPDPVKCTLKQKQLNRSKSAVYSRAKLIGIKRR